MKFSIPSDSEDEIASKTEMRLSRSQEILIGGKMAGESARVEAKEKTGSGGHLVEMAR